MIELGKTQKLQVVRKTTIGVYLNEADDMDSEDILLPKRQLPPDIEIGQELDVFIYKDSEDRKIATTTKPKLSLGEIGFLKVKQVTEIGAFLDWGLEKDLFLPFKEQKVRVKEEREYLVGLYIDKSERLCATMDISKFLSNESPHKQDDQVEGIIYSINSDIGAFVVVEAKYDGLIPNKELYRNYKVGEKVEARVTNVREDGKLDLSIREKAYKEIDKDAAIILDRLSKNHGKLFINDKSSPNIIKEELNMSKSAFKKAVGKLLKTKEIKFIENGIEKIEKI